MTNSNDIKVIKIHSTAYNTCRALSILIANHVTELRNMGLTVVDISVDNEDAAIKIVAQRSHDYKISARPVMVLPEKQTKSSPRRDEAKMRDYYNRVQSLKYNVAKHSYKEHKI